MKTHWLRTAALLLCLLFSLTTAVRAVPDLERPCSITITMRDGQTSVAGGTLELYQVGEAVEENGNYTFQITADFAGTGDTLDDLTHAEEIAVRMENCAKTLEPLATVNIGDDGRAGFPGLTAGVYLVVQSQAAPGYERLRSFLVSVPYLEDGEYCYDLTANPKTELEKEPPTDPTKPVGPTKPTGPDLPQTGQLQWPVPVLVCTGLLLLALGIVLRRREANKP